MSVFKPDPETRVYKVEPTSNVTAAVIIGNAGRGGWAMTLTGQATVKGTDSNNDPVLLGKGADVVGKFLQVDVTVIDVRPETDRLSSVVTINGGPAGALAIPQEVRDKADGDVAIFTTVVMFQ
jgi:hypothetical protein